MSEPTWQTLNLDAAAETAKAFETFKSSASAVIEVVETIIGIAKTIADLILAVYVDLANLELEVIRAAIGALRTIVEAFTKSSGAYMLAVPLKIADPHQWFGDPKTYYVGNTETKLSNPVLTTYDPFSHANQPEGGTAGNYGFYATIAESLQDYDDPSRPELDANAYIAAVVFLFGADNYMELVILLKKLMRLFNLPGVDLAPDAVPTPKNVRYTIIPQSIANDDTFWSEILTEPGDPINQPHAVKIEWDKDSKDWLNTAYSSSVYTEIDKVYLYRWEEGLATPDQVRAGAHDNVDVWSHEYDDQVPLFIDTNIVPGTTYYYGLSYSYKVLNAEGVERYTIEPPDVDLVSLRVDFPADLKVGPSKGNPPDWFSINVIPAIPPLQNILSFILNWLDRIEASIYTGKDELEDFVKFLTTEINRYHRWITEISNEIQELIDALTLPEAYAGMLAIEGKGGTQFFMDQLGRGMFHDPNRPPFDKGTEAVAGIVLLAGSETPGKLESFWSVMNLLFGGMMSTSKNTMAEAISQMNAFTEELDRQVCLTKGLTEQQCAEEANNTTVGPDLEPSNESSDCSAAAQEAYDNFLKGNS